VTRGPGQRKSSWPAKRDGGWSLKWQKKRDQKKTFVPGQKKESEKQKPQRPDKKTRADSQIFVSKTKQNAGRKSNFWRKDGKKKKEKRRKEKIKVFPSLRLCCKRGGQKRKSDRSREKGPQQVGGFYLAQEKNLVRKTKGKKESAELVKFAEVRHPLIPLHHR